MPCNCVEGRFERTANMFVGREDLPFVRDLMKVKTGTTLAAPPVHDCAYIRVRNTLATLAQDFARQEVRGMRYSSTAEKAERDAKEREIYTAEIRRLIAEHYSSGTPPPSPKR